MLFRVLYVHVSRFTPLLPCWIVNVAQRNFHSMFIRVQIRYAIPVYVISVLGENKVSVFSGSVGYDISGI